MTCWCYRSILTLYFEDSEGTSSRFRSASGDILFSLVSFELRRLAATFFPLRRTKFLVETLYSRVYFAAVAPCRLRTGRNPGASRQVLGGEVSGGQEAAGRRSWPGC